VLFVYDCNVSEFFWNVHDKGHEIHATSLQRQDSDTRYNDHFIYAFRHCFYVLSDCHNLIFFCHCLLLVSGKTSK